MWMSYGSLFLGTVMAPSHFEVTALFPAGLSHPSEPSTFALTSVTWTLAAGPRPSLAGILGSSADPLYTVWSMVMVQMGAGGV